MNPSGLVRGIVCVALMAVASLSGAQEAGFRAAYINSQYLLTLHPIYPQLLTLQEQARSEVYDLNQRAQELLSKQQAGTELTLDESDLLNITLTTLQAVSARYDADIKALLEPAFDEISRLVAETAEELGLTMVFDYSAARETGLIVYAQPNTDITELVKEKLVDGL